MVEPDQQQVAQPEARAERTHRKRRDARGEAGHGPQLTGGRGRDVEVVRHLREHRGERDHGRLRREQGEEEGERRARDALG